VGVHVLYFWSTVQHNNHNITTRQAMTRVIYIAFLYVQSALLVDGLLPSPRFCCHRSWSSLNAVDKDPTSTLPPVGAMRAGEIKKELERYGISTKSFLEKSELVGALEKARLDGLTPVTTSSAAEDHPRSRQDRLQDEMKKCESLKLSEMKKELESLGIATTSFLEKSEFVRALAEARVDGTKKKPSEGYAEYDNVEVLTDDKAGPRPKGSEQKKDQSGSNPFSSNPIGGGNPFAGASGAGGGPFGGSNPFGGAGGMGGMADMLKNMGMGQTGGGNPFGAGNPFGGMDAGAFNKAQEMMKKPKVQEIMRKAQSNPNVLRKINECMSNPAAFMKYKDDPEVAELIKELQSNM